MIKAVLFDIDGTLLDTSELLFQAFEFAIRSQNLVPPSREEMAKVIGVSLEECYLVFAPEGDNKILCEVHQDFQLKNPQLSKVFPETVSVLKSLNQMGIKSAGITNRLESTAGVSIKRAGIEKYLEFVNYRDGFEKIKPDPQMLLHAIKKLSVNKDEVLMVGDTGTDLEAAKNAGIMSVGVTYGFLGERIADLEPDYLIDNLGELPVIVNS